MHLSTLAILLGLGFGLPQLLGLFKPHRFREITRGFPRSDTWGYTLVLLGTGWFLWNLQLERISDFAPYKPIMLFGFAGIGILTCIFVRDFLAVRGLAIVLLLLAKLALDTQRWADTGWKNIITVWAYLWILAGIWFTVSPWYFRDWIHWNTATDRRIRIGCSLRLAFSLTIILLGLTVYRAANHPAFNPTDNRTAIASQTQPPPGNP
jgi:hypothetical protein